MTKTELQEKVDELIDNNEFDTAIKYIDKILQLDSNHKNSYLNLIQIYTHKYDYKKLEEASKKLLRLDNHKKNRIVVVFAKTVVLFKIEKYSKSLNYANQAILLQKTSYFLNFRAQINLKIGAIEAAIVDLTNAIELDPENYTLYNLREKQFLTYRIFLEKEKYGPKSSPDGRGYFQVSFPLDKAIEDEPNNPVHYLLRAKKTSNELNIPEMYYIHFGDDKDVLEGYKQMMSDYDKALQIEPMNPFALVERSIHRENKSIDDLVASIKDNKKAKKVSPKNSSNYIDATKNIKFLKKKLRQLQNNFIAESTVYFDDLKNKVVEYIISSQIEIKIAVAWITDHSIISALYNKQKSGVQITLVYYDDHINDKNRFEMLFNCGAIIKCSKKLIHHKFCIIDQKVVLNGSFNWTDNAERNNKENIQVSNNLKLVSKFLVQFDELLQYCKSPLKTANQIKQEILDHYEQWYKYGRIFNDADWSPCMQIVKKGIRQTLHKSHFIVLGKSLYIERSEYAFDVINSGYYVLQTKEHANEFLYQMYFLQREYNLNTVQNVTGKNFNLPLRLIEIEDFSNEGNEESLSLLDKTYFGTAIIPSIDGSEYVKKGCNVTKDNVYFD